MTNWRPIPATVYALVERAPGAVLLESSGPGSAHQSSKLFLEPLRILRASTPSAIPELFAQIESAVAAGQYVAGLLAYECGQAFEPVAGLPAASPSQLRSLPSTSPLAWFGVFERSYAFDHRSGEFVGGAPPGLADLVSTSSNDDTEAASQIELAPALTEQEFAHSIDSILEWIRAGDVYQLNFTFPLSGRTTSGPAALYARLRSRQPVDYGAFLHWQQGRHILSFSPELFFRIDNSATRRITTQPMKGTARRGRTTAEDRAIAERLQSDPKNRAENVMIVDLLRNDLGRLCTFGSVEVRELFALERYPTLWQMTSTIVGNLRPDAGFYDIFRALFPCGSITGAPKVRAMQLIAELERKPRGIYTGAIGFFSRERTVFNVAIRTISVDGDKATMGVGSGIVIDSYAADEFRECQLKAEFLTQQEESFPLIETMLWKGTYPLIELHLDRLTDSADYFGFKCDRDQIRNALLSAVASLSDQQPRKVRLLLDSDGSAHIEHELLPSKLEPQPPRVCISAQRTDANDRFLFHKTTHRPLYASAFKAASEAGFADVLFLNQPGEVTEGAISNLFIERAGRWFTPPISCGVLPGVYRRHLLATRPEIEERVLTLDDLKAADAVHLANAVRGLRRVLIDWDFRL